MDAAGRLGGIARRAALRSPMETVGRVFVSVEHGVTGDARSAAASAKATRRRQVSLLEAESWRAALDELGALPAERPCWSERRANLLIESLRLPRAAGVKIAIGAQLRLETTVETAPCWMMDALVPGLEAALTSDWRGGLCARVVQGGEIALGDEIWIEG